MLLQRGCIPRSGCQRQRAGQRAGTKAQGGLRPDGSGGARRSLQADYAGGALSRPDGSRAQRQAATDSSRGRIARAQGKPLASGANPSRKPPAPARARRRTGQRRRSSPETDQQRAAAAPRKRRNTDRRGRGAKTKQDAQPSSRPHARRSRSSGGGARGEGVYRFAFPRKSGESERAAKRREGSPSCPQRCIITRQRMGAFSRERLQSGCFRRFSFGCLGFWDFGFSSCVRCFYSIKLRDSPPTCGGLLRLYESCGVAYLWV